MSSGFGVAVFSFRLSATAVATFGASTSGVENRATASWMLALSVDSSEKPVTPSIRSWKKCPP